MFKSPESDQDSITWQSPLLLEIFRITFTVNGTNGHVTMFILYLPLALYNFSVKLSSFALASEAKIILHYSLLCSHFVKKTSTRISRLRFAVNAILNLSVVFLLAGMGCV